jgi:hypothetical protein
MRNCLEVLKGKGHANELAEKRSAGSYRKILLMKIFPLLLSPPRHKYLLSLMF